MARQLADGVIEWGPYQYYHEVQTPYGTFGIQPGVVMRIGTDEVPVFIDVDSAEVTTRPDTIEQPEHIEQPEGFDPPKIPMATESAEKLAGEIKSGEVRPEYPEVTVTDVPAVVADPADAEADPFADDPLPVVEVPVTTFPEAGVDETVVAVAAADEAATGETVTAVGQPLEGEGVPAVNSETVQG